MKFTDLSKECPKAWEDFRKWSYENIEKDLYINVFINAKDNPAYDWGHISKQLVGYLIEDYFPSKGVEIDKRTLYKDISQAEVAYEYTVFQVDGAFEDTFDTLEEAIVKAFQILEEK